MLPQRLWHILRLSFHSLLVHRLRSFLTILGIDLGVASVIVMLAVGEAARYEAIRQIQELGATNILVESVKPEDEKKNPDDEGLTLFGVNRADMDRIRATIPTVVATLPVREFRKDLRYLDRKLEGRVVSVTPEYQALNGLRLSKGRFITGLDNERFENVAVLAAETAEVLFPVEDPLGRTVRIDEQHYFRVVGVAEPRHASGLPGQANQDFNRDVYIPFDTDRVRFGSVVVYYRSGNFKVDKYEISRLTVMVDRMENVKRTAAVLKDTLEQFHPQKDTVLTVPLDLLERAEKTQRVFTWVLAVIGGISLVVGGIGIMNIMLATVTERTREIGIRRALGAKRRDIAWQFLVETMTLSGLGGFLGVGLGVGLTWLVTHFLAFPTILRVWSVFLALGVSVLVGLVFGTYPARRAAHMDPIEALRHE